MSSTSQKAGDFTTILFILFYKEKDVHKLITIDHINAHSLFHSAEAFMSVTRLLESTLPLLMYVAAPYSIPEERTEVVGIVLASVGSNTHLESTSCLCYASIVSTHFLITYPVKRQNKELLSMPFKRVY